MEQIERETVFMRHPETGGLTEASREAFDVLWKDKGWEIDPNADRAQVEHERRLAQVLPELSVEDLSKATKETLTEVAGQLGRTVPPKASKEKLREIVESPVSPEDGSTTTAQQ